MSEEVGEGRQGPEKPVRGTRTPGFERVSASVLMAHHRHRPLHLLLFLLTLFVIHPAVKGYTFWTTSTYNTSMTTIGECPDRHYGANCSQKCDHCFNGSSCDKLTGACPSGCVPGWKYFPANCSEECDAGYYGNNCSSTCSAHCRNENCSKVDGTCSRCHDGFYTPACQACPDRHYGANCSQKCDHCFNGSSCDKVTGACPSGCEAGWQYFPETCSQECPDFSFGVNCSGRCGNCTSGSPCDKVSGICRGGCMPGWMSPNCSTGCPNGTFGINCIQTCGRCSDPPCNTVDGSCGACEPGYSWPKCNTNCSSRFYGVNCSKRCGECEDVCSATNGSCQRCKYNRELPLCQVCVSGWWDITCSSSCPNCGGSGRCDRVTGVCSDEVCQVGWMSPRCDKKCQADTYGANCSKQCGHCAGRSSCRHDNGMCELDCEDGYEGVLCQKKTFVIPVIIGSALGAGGLIAVAIVIAACCIRRRNRANTQQHSDLIVLSPAGTALEDPVAGDDNCNTYVNHDSTSDVTNEYEAVVKDTGSHTYSTSVDRMRDLPEPAYQNYSDTGMTTTHSANNFSDEHLYSNTH